MWKNKTDNYYAFNLHPNDRYIVVAKLLSYFKLKTLEIER